MRRGPALLQVPEPGRVLAARDGRGRRRATAARRPSRGAASPRRAASSRYAGTEDPGGRSSRRWPRSRTCSSTAGRRADALGLAEVYVGGRPDGWQDDFLMRADKNPNRKGLELVASALGLALTLQPFAELGQRGRRRARSRRSGRSAPRCRYDRRWSPTARDGSSTSWSRRRTSRRSPRRRTCSCRRRRTSRTDGTFVNFEGIAQRFRAGLPARGGGSRPHWALAAVAWRRSSGSPWRSQTGRERLPRSSGPAGAALAGFDWDGAAPPVKVTPARLDPARRRDGGRAARRGTASRVPPRRPGRY